MTAPLCLSSPPPLKMCLRVCVCVENQQCSSGSRVFADIFRVIFFFVFQLKFRFQIRSHTNGMATVQCSRIYFNTLYKVYRNELNKDLPTWMTAPFLPDIQPVSCTSTRRRPCVCSDGTASSLCVMKFCVILRLPFLFFPLFSMCPLQPK